MSPEMNGPDLGSTGEQLLKEPAAEELIGDGWRVTTRVNFDNFYAEEPSDERYVENLKGQYGRDNVKLVRIGEEGSTTFDVYVKEPEQKEE